MTDDLGLTKRAHSYSSLQTLQRCEAQYAYRYPGGLRRARAASPDQIRGTAWHAVLQADLIWRGALCDSLLQRPESIEPVDGLKLHLDWAKPDEPCLILPGGLSLVCRAEGVIEALHRWWRGLDPEEEERLAAAFGKRLDERLTDIWTEYQIRWGVEADQIPLLTEVTWNRTTKSGVRLTGRVDAVIRDERRGVVVVRDNKSHDGWPQGAEDVISLMDSQLHLQAWGLMPLLGDENRPGAVEFDRAIFLMLDGNRKKLPVPTWTKDGKLSASVTKFTEHAYRRACSEEGKPVDEEMVAKARTSATGPAFGPDDWFRRSLKPLSLPTIKAHVRALEKAARRADDVEIETAVISPGSTCGWCDYLPLCQTVILSGRPDPFVPGDYGLRQR